MVKKINADDAQEILNLLDKMGLEFPDGVAYGAAQQGVPEHRVRTGRMTEKSTLPAYTAMTAEQLEATVEKGKPIVVKIDDAVFANIQDIIQQYKDGQYWYREFNKIFMGILGESDGCLFLAIFASYGTRLTVLQNSRRAIRLFAGVKHDVAVNKALFEKFVATMGDPKHQSAERDKLKASNFTRTNTKGQEYRIKPVGPYQDSYSVMSHTDEGKEFESLKSYQVIVDDMDAHMGNNFRILAQYIKNGYQFTQADFVRQLEGGMDAAGRLKDKADDHYIIGGHKIMSYALNLLAPDMDFKGLPYLPVTVDTWMLTFLFPHMTRDEINVMFGDYKQYIYNAKKIADLAGKVGMKPHELQAIIWMSVVNTQGHAGERTMESALKKEASEIGQRADQWQELTDFAAKIKNALASVK
jgi:hypothetical protein